MSILRKIACALLYAFGITDEKGEIHKAQICEHCLTISKVGKAKWIVISCDCMPSDRCLIGMEPCSHCPAFNFERRKLYIPFKLIKGGG